MLDSRVRVVERVEVGRYRFGKGATGAAFRGIQLGQRGLPCCPVDRVGRAGFGKQGAERRMQPRQLIVECCDLRMKALLERGRELIQALGSVGLVGPVSEELGGRSGEQRSDDRQRQHRVDEVGDGQALPRTDEAHLQDGQREENHEAEDDDDQQRDRRKQAGFGGEFGGAPEPDEVPGGARLRGAAVGEREGDADGLDEGRVDFLGQRVRVDGRAVEP